MGAPAGPGRDPSLALFCDWYVRWLAAPFRRGLLAPIAGPARQRGAWLPPVGPVAPCCIRSFFALEVVSFCARAFVRCPKFFLLRTRLLSAVLVVLGRGGAAGSPNRLGVGTGNSINDGMGLDEGPNGRNAGPRLRRCELRSTRALRAGVKVGRGQGWRQIH